MIDIGHDEAILFRVLAAFFGRDRVVPQMSLLAVCGGALPEALHQSVSSAISVQCKQSPNEWAKANKCLFTIVREDDSPVLVIEYLEDFPRTVDAARVMRLRFVKPILEAAGIPLITMSAEELSDITRPDSGVDFCALLKAKYEYATEPDA